MEKGSSEIEILLVSRGSEGKKVDEIIHEEEVIIRIDREIHSYDIPEIIALPIIGGNQHYLEWTGREVK